MPERIDSIKEAAIRQRFPGYPFPSLLGMEIVSLEVGRAHLTLKCRQELTQGMGYLHGGVISTLCDTSVAIALFTMIEEDEKILTIELKVNFLAPADEDIQSQARIIHKGRRTAVGEVDVTDRAGTLLAKGLVTYYIYRD
jgi:uncharacterized protein (TIGR00369 family)